MNINYWKLSYIEKVVIKSNIKTLSGQELKNYFVLNLNDYGHVNRLRVTIL